jgi:hypothetical protein
MEGNAGLFVVSSSRRKTGQHRRRHHRAQSIAAQDLGLSNMLRLTDAQLSVIRRLAEPLLYVDRDRFLQRVAELLRGHEIGDGVVYRAAEQAQKEFRRSVTLEDRPGKYA